MTWFCGFESASDSYDMLFIGSAVNSFLGPNKSLKYIVDGNNTFLVSCSLPLLQSVKFTSPVMHMIEETVYSHHKQHGCGAQSLLAMWYFWNKELKKLVNEGMLINDIISFAQNGVQMLIRRLHKIEIPLKSIIKPSSKTVPLSTLREHNYQDMFFEKNVAFSSSNVIHHHQPRNCELKRVSSCSIKSIPKGILFSSRHFSPSQSQHVNEFDAFSEEQEKILHMNDERTTNSVVYQKSDLYEVVQKLNHEGLESIDLIVDVWYHQLKEQSTAMFHHDEVLVLDIVAPSSCSCVISGLLLKMYSGASVSSHCILGQKNCKALLISGDITFSYKHLGFSPESKMQVVKTVEEISCVPNDMWLMDCVNLLHKLQISVLLVKGTIDSSARDVFFRHSIFLISSISTKTYKILTNACNVFPCAYLLGCDERNILNINVEPWEISIKTAVEYVVIQINSSLPKVSLQTVVLCHPCPAALSLYKHQFQHIICRLSNVCKENVLLPGGGFTEMWCYKTMLEMACKKKGAEKEVLKAVANGYNLYYELVLSKKQFDGNGGKAVDVLDERESKIQSWYSALTLLNIMRVDSFIVNDSHEINDIYHNSYPIIGYL